MRVSGSTTDTGASLLRHPRLAQALDSPVKKIDDGRIGVRTHALSLGRLPCRNRPEPQSVGRERKETLERFTGLCLMAGQGERRDDASIRKRSIRNNRDRPAADIDLDRARGEGPRVLKRFLQYAEFGVLEEQISTSEDADFPFEETVSDFIQGLEYKVDKQVGSAGFKIDLAVRHPDQPGRYMLAVECDGATYHSGLWARERDRLRQEILENMGWRFHRIWSTDWFYRRGQATQKLKTALEAAKLEATPTPRKAETKSTEPPAQSEVTPVPTPTVAPELRMPPYRLAADILIPHNIEPHEVTVAVMARITSAIVQVEGPVHEQEVARRVTGLFGKSRTGSLITAATLRSLQALKASSSLIEQDGFWMTADQMRDPPVQDRSSAPITLQRADMLSRLEIRAAFQIVQRENGSMSEEEAAVAIARLLGFKRTGADLKTAILSAIGT